MGSGPEAFNIEIAGQMAAWFLGKVPGKSVNCLKLMKLLYLAERSFIERYGYPTLGDRLVSTPEGPILEGTLRHMKGRGTSNNGWNMWVSPVRNREVSPAREYKPEDLDLLSGSSFCKYELTCCYYWQIDGFVCAVSDYSRFLTSRSSNALPCNSVGGTTSS